MIGTNCLYISAESATNSGVEFTRNIDGSFTANGTATSTLIFYVGIFSPTKGFYIISGCPDGGGDTTYRCDIRRNNGGVISIDEGPNAVPMADYPKTFSARSGEKLWYTIRIASEYTCNNLTFYPMIRPSYITDDTYNPYSMRLSDISVKAHNVGKFQFIYPQYAAAANCYWYKLGRYYTVSNGWDVFNMILLLPHSYYGYAMTYIQFRKIYDGSFNTYQCYAELMSYSACLASTGETIPTLKIGFKFIDDHNCDLYMYKTDPTAGLRRTYSIVKLAQTSSDYNSSELERYFTFDIHVSTYEDEDFDVVYTLLPKQE